MWWCRYWQESTQSGGRWARDIDDYGDVVYVILSAAQLASMQQCALAHLAACPPSSGGRSRLSNSCRQQQQQQQVLPTHLSCTSVSCCQQCTQPSGPLIQQQRHPEALYAAAAVTVNTLSKAIKSYTSHTSQVDLLLLLLLQGLLPGTFKLCWVPVAAGQSVW